MADRIDPKQFKVVKGLGARMRDLPSSDKADPRRFKVVKGLGARMRALPSNRADRLQRRTNPAPTNNTNNPDRKAQEDAQSNHEQD